MDPEQRRANQRAAERARRKRNPPKPLSPEQRERRNQAVWDYRKTRKKPDYVCPAPAKPGTAAQDVPIARKNRESITVQGRKREASQTSPSKRIRRLPKRPTCNTGMSSTIASASFNPCCPTDWLPRSPHIRGPHGPVNNALQCHVARHSSARPPDHPDPRNIAMPHSSTVAFTTTIDLSQTLRRVPSTRITSLPPPGIVSW